MNSRERFACAMRHETPDRPPIDLGSTTLTAMSLGCQSALRAYRAHDPEADRLSRPRIPADDSTPPI